MKRIAAALALMSLCSMAIAGTPYSPDPALSHWYSTYTTTINGVVYRTYTPATEPFANLELISIIQQYAPKVRSIDPRTGNMAWDGTNGPNEEAQLLLQWKWAIPSSP